MTTYADSQGFKVVFVGFRGSGGAELTHGKLYCAARWIDIKEPVDYIYDTYCKSTDRKVYLYALSLGAIMSTNYLIRAGQETPLSGAIFYGTPFNIYDGQEYF
mmetsp:Transcript_32541/g.23508  ORF Transcript_32541/g.23508 Transcript_32541/m.23508 type:complete len:103 (+) Transcript_32541:350-658(+)